MPTPAGGGERAATTNLALRREVFDAAGLFDEGPAYGSDRTFTAGFQQADR